MKADINDQKLWHDARAFIFVESKKVESPVKLFPQKDIYHSSNRLQFWQRQYLAQFLIAQ
jgi:hypothetical protein